MERTITVGAVGSKFESRTLMKRYQNDFPSSPEVLAGIQHTRAPSKYTINVLVKIVIAGSSVVDI